jgi:hypothetical protein
MMETLFLRASLHFTALNSTSVHHKVPKKKTAMGFGETIYSKTKSAGYSRRETQCN